VSREKGFTFQAFCLFKSEANTTINLPRWFFVSALPSLLLIKQAVPDICKLDSSLPLLFRQSLHLNIWVELTLAAQSNAIFARQNLFDNLRKTSVKTNFAIQQFTPALNNKNHHLQNVYLNISQFRHHRSASSSTSYTRHHFIARLRTYSSTTSISR
jgi:hypothetical protein